MKKLFSKIQMECLNTKREYKQQYTKYFVFTKPDMFFNDWLM